MKKALIASMALVALALFVSYLAGSTPAVAEDTDGKALFTANKCSMCHSVPAAGIEAKVKSESMKGKDLGGPVEFDKVAGFLRKQSQIDGKDHKNEFKGTDEELKAILDWLGGLEAGK